MDYTQRKNLGWLIDRLENNQDVIAAVKACGPSSWWAVGSVAAGKQLRGPWILVYRAEAGVVQGADQGQADMAIGAQALAVAAAASRAVGQVASLVQESLIPHGSDESCERLELPGLWRASRS
jgi:hypothetical protein